MFGKAFSAALGVFCAYVFVWAVLLVLVVILAIALA